MELDATQYLGYKHKPSCFMGHEFTADNVYIYRTKGRNRYRSCLQCHRMHSRIRSQELSAARKLNKPYKHKSSAIRQPEQLTIPF